MSNDINGAIVMNPDLVERLRDGSAIPCATCAVEFRAIATEAADRIEQLEDDLQDCQSRAITQRGDLRYRIEQLEAALREIDRVAAAHTRGSIGIAQDIVRKVLRAQPRLPEDHTQ